MLIHIITPAVLDIKCVEENMRALAVNLRDANPHHKFKHHVSVDPFIPPGGQGSSHDIGSCYWQLRGQNWEPDIFLNTQRLGAYTNFPATCARAVIEDPDDNSLSIVIEDDAILMHPLILDDLIPVLKTHNLHMATRVGPDTSERPFIRADDKTVKLGHHWLRAPAQGYMTHGGSFFPHALLKGILKELKPNKHLEDQALAWYEKPMYIVYGPGGTGLEDHMTHDAPRYANNIRLIGVDRIPARNGNEHVWSEIRKKL